MSPSRRTFLEAAAVNAAALAILPHSLAALPADLVPGASSADWDLTWVNRLGGKYRAVFDCSEIESGYGVWRASAWAGQYADVMKATPAQLSPIVILRHNAIALAMNQAYWDKYGVGEKAKVLHPMTAEPTKLNPVLLGEKDGIPAPFNQASLPKQIERGVVVLACNLAFEQCVQTVKSADNVSAEEARRRALTFIVPGVILQPSGVFAAVRAQEAGAAYVKAS